MIGALRGFSHTHRARANVPVDCQGKALRPRNGLAATNKVSAQVWVRAWETRVASPHGLNARQTMALRP